MDTATQPWERQPKEPSQAFDRFQRYLYLGASRSVYHAYVQVRDERQRKRPAAAGRSGAPKSWRDLAKRWRWQERAEAWDTDQRRKRDALFAAQSDEILKSGFASRFARIAELNRLAELLQQEVWEADKRWLPDAKWIGGDVGERVDIVRFNTSVIEQYRKTLDDIAIEMGERERGLKVSGSVGVVQFAADELAKAKEAAAQAERELLDGM